MCNARCVHPAADGSALAAEYAAMAVDEADAAAEDDEWWMEMDEASSLHPRVQRHLCQQQLGQAGQQAGRAGVVAEGRVSAS